MMKHKSGIVALAALGGLALQGTLPMEASAATTVNDQSTVINLMGQSSISADHVVATDPWSGHLTSWVPVYYLQRALKSAGVQTTWNTGGSRTLNVTSAPKGWTLNVAGTSTTGTPPKGQMQFSIDGDANGFIRAPRLVAKDPASGVYTTYVPVYYADLFLHNRLSMGAVWSGGTSWTLAPQPVITKTTYSDAAAAGQQVQTIQHENTYLAFGPGSQTVDLGLGITAREDAGMSHAGLQWHEGSWTVEVLWLGGNQGGKQLAENVVSYLHTHYLPSPNSAGTIVISSVDYGGSTKLQPATTIAWQEGSVVNQLQTLEPPLTALQTVVNSNNG